MTKSSRNPNTRRIYHFIPDHRREYPVEMMCKVLEVAPAWGRRAQRSRCARREVARSARSCCNMSAKRSLEAQSGGFAIGE